MNWVRDATSRFERRPYYTASELEDECESLVLGFLTSRHGIPKFPITTDELTILIETLVDDLDLFADLSRDGAEVEGVTTFFADRRPTIKIDHRLSDDPRMVNRFRTTLSHELGHVVFHRKLFGTSHTGFLFEGNAASSNVCKRGDIIDAPQVDWMEWQAGFACGALLMPRTELTMTIRQVAEDGRLSGGKFTAASHEAGILIDAVSRRFSVSRDAARVRLQQRGIVVLGAVPGALF